MKHPVMLGELNELPSIFFFIGCLVLEQLCTGYILIL